MHGVPLKAMQLGATSITPTKLSKVKHSVHVGAVLYNSDSVFQSKNYFEQGCMAPGTISDHKKKNGPMIGQHTYEQIVAFGGIQEEALREVRSSAADSA
jgi:hypothetical protein